MQYRFVMRAFLLIILCLALVPLSYAAPYDLSKLKYKYFRHLFPPANSMVPSPADYKFVGEWIRRKGENASDYNIKVKSYVYKSATHHLVYIKFKNHGLPFCWWFSKLTDGKPPKGWAEGACDVNNDGMYEKVWDLNGYDTLHWNFCSYWDCESY